MSDGMMAGEPEMRAAIKRYGAVRVAFAVAHDLDPADVENEDGGVQEVATVLAVAHWMDSEALASALGMDHVGTPDDHDIAEFIGDLRTAANR